MTPRIRYHGDGWRVVQVELPPQQRENADDDGLRDLIEVADGKDLMGEQRWTRLDKKAEGVGTYDRIIHAMKRSLLELIDQLETEKV